MSLNIRVATQTETAATAYFTTVSAVWHCMVEYFLLIVHVHKQFTFFVDLSAERIN